MKYIFTLFFTLALALTTYAQQAGYQVGQTAANFTLISESGAPVSLTDFTSGKAVVVVFVNKNCPNSRLYEKRMSDLAAAYANKGVTFMFINPTISLELGGTQAKALADKVMAEPANLPLLPDPEQKVSLQFGATKTPEAFLLQNQNGTFVLKYKGAIDDNPQLETSVRQTYLLNALDAVLANKPIALTEKRATGCMIKRF